MIGHKLSALLPMALALAIGAAPCRAQAERFPDPLPTSTDAQIKAAEPVAAVKTSLWNSDGVWAFRGIIGPLALWGGKITHRLDLGWPHVMIEFRSSGLAGRKERISVHEQVRDMKWNAHLLYSSPQSPWHWLLAVRLSEV